MNDSNLLNIINHMYNNLIFNTYVTHIDDDDTQLSIILRTKRPKLSHIIGHLNKHIRISETDPIIGEMCAICFDEYKPKQYKRILDKCGHYFHKKCIDKWFRKNPTQMTCPICRTPYNRVLSLHGL